jgi:glycosyltransferase involved in cell wall biosynthesis
MDTRGRLSLVVESGTDVRLVEGLANLFDLTILARPIPGGVVISQTPSVPVKTLLGPTSRLSFARTVYRHLRAHRSQIDLVVVQGYVLAALAANLASRRSGTKTIMLVCSPSEAYYRCRKRNADPGKPYRWFELLAYQLLARLNAMLGRRYVVLSRYLEGVVRAHGTRRLVDVIPVYGVDTKLFSPAGESRKRIRERLGLPTSGSLLFFSSRVAPEKDTETLLEAVRRLRTAGRDLWILNRSGGYERLLAIASSLGIRDRVIATNAVHPHRELPLTYQASDLCVQASREEGLGFSPLEALSCEVPVVAAAVGGLLETVIDGTTGWTYRVGDAGALARRIGEVLDDPAEAARRARAGRALVQREYDREIVFSKLVRALGSPP